MNQSAVKKHRGIRQGLDSVLHPTLWPRTVQKPGHVGSDTMNEEVSLCYEYSFDFHEGVDGIIFAFDEGVDKVVDKGADKGVDTYNCNPSRDQW